MYVQQFSQPALFFVEKAGKSICLHHTATHLVAGKQVSAIFTWLVLRVVSRPKTTSIFSVSCPDLPPPQSYFKIITVAVTVFMNFSNADKAKVSK